VKTTCITWIALYIILALGCTVWFFLRFPASPANPTYLPETAFRIKVALVGGFLTALPALFTLSMLYTGWLRVQERARLSVASEGGLPEDGKQGVFYGPIHCDGPPLKAPLSRRECLLYRYEITHIKSRSQFGKNRVSDDTITDTVVDAEGFALTPSTIRTVRGPVKLLTLVKPEFKPDCFSLDQISENYKAYAATARLKRCGSLEMHPSLQKSLHNDADGAIRYDLGTGELDPANALLIKEHIVQHGDTVVVFGKYSAARGGIVYDPDSVGDTRLRKGSLDSLKKSLAMNALGYVLGAIAWCVAAATGIWVFFRFGPSHIWD